MAASRLVAVITCVYLWQGGADSLQWDGDVEDREEIQRCEGQEVVFPWKFTEEAGDSLVGVTWNRIYSDSKEENLASLVSFSNNFNSQNSRVSHQPQYAKASIKLSGLVVNDTADYVVSVRLSGVEILPMQTVSLTVAAQPQTVDDKLEMMEVDVDSSMAVSHSQVTSDGRKGLKCGQFLSLGYPPVSVSWQDPEGIVLPSTIYEDGFFYLHFDERHKGGNYQCLLNESQPAMSCLPETSGLRQSVSVQVVGPPPPPAKASLDGGVVAGVVIAIIVFIVVAVAIAIFLIKSKRGKSYAPKEPESPVPGDDHDVHEPLKA